MKSRIAFYTFGCRLNQAETAIIQQSFEQNKYQVVDYRDSADVVVVNTCTVTENGDADTRKLVNKISRINPDAKIALVGCQAQVQWEKLFDLPGVQWVVGNANKMDLVKIFESGGFDTPQLITPPIPKKSFTIPIAGIDKQHTRANLKIQDGCDFFCSFCEIPYARGRARSRKFDDLLLEADTLAKAGHHELVITGINIGTYWNQDKDILDVLSALEDIDGLWRVRISSIEPTTIPVDIFSKMKNSKQLCRYLHIPLQSGSDFILEKMKRNYAVQEFSTFLLEAKKAVNGVCLGTDVIVGFPGETEDYFCETYQLLLELPLAYFHVFSYSDRDHAKSSRYPEKVPLERIRERSQRLRELSIRKRRFFMESFIGQTEMVLFEQKKNELWSGLTDNYIRVKVKSDLNLENQLLPVRIEEVEDQSIAGTLV
jgi:threonylcarbamoyladenosine tRNA methylthiotransferase MtaB